MMSTRRYSILGVSLGLLFLVLLGCGGLAALLPITANPFWYVFSGYYRYDPRHDTPPAELFLDRPEVSLKYYLDATLAGCNGRYPPVSNRPVQRYEVEAVEYFGKNDYYPLSYVHARLFYAGSSAVPVTFVFQAGTAASDVWTNTNTQAGSWMVVDGLIESPAAFPPHVGTYPHGHPRTCEEVGRPFAIDDEGFRTK
jgi:hypothetical protein